MSTVTYPFDTTGTAASNLIINEEQPIQGVNYQDYYLIAPKLGPFYGSSLVVKYTDTVVNLKTLVLGVDYTLTLPYWAAIRSIGIPIYGAITLLDTTLTGTVSLDYQILGGQWCTNVGYALKVLNEQMYNPRSILWDLLIDKPQLFPPLPHPEDIYDLYGMDSIITDINEMSAIILNAPPKTITYDVPYIATILNII
jgi:hypothetical protein